MVPCNRMTFLHIVERELRVSARKRGTYLSRVSVALVSIVIGGCIFLPSFDEPEKVVGPRIFIGLSILGLCYCLLAGRRFTVDCLSEEKREGTLGLLFLTDLKGHDVVLGKLAATSLNGFFSLLALLPVLAVPLMMGGVSNSQFWRMALVLVSTFLFSLAVGIYASAKHRTINRAAATNLGLMFLFALAIPLLALLTVSYFFHPSRPSLIPWPVLSTSPIFAFVFSFDSNYRIAPASFWYSVGTINTLTCLLIYRAARIVPHSWQDSPHAVAPDCSPANSPAFAELPGGRQPRRLSQAPPRRECLLLARGARPPQTSLGLAFPGVRRRLVDLGLAWVGQ